MRERSRERSRERMCVHNGSINNQEASTEAHDDQCKEEDELTLGMLVPKGNSPEHPEDNRSTKKVKIRSVIQQDQNGVISTVESGIPMDEDSESNQSIPKSNLPTGTASFLDKLLNRDRASEAEDDFVLDEDDIEIGKKGIFPSINFSPRVHKALEDSMRFSVVLKLLGRPIGYQRLRDHLTRMWTFASPFRLTDLEGGCFIATLSNENDYRTVLTEGPWVITGHYLTVHPWSPDFSPIQHSISQVVAWIRIPGLPTKYYKKNIIRAIGRVLGHVIRIDYNTESGERGKFARMAVILDLSKPLTSKIVVDGTALLIEYEGLPTICFCCGRYGHLEESCPLKNTPPEAAPIPISEIPVLAKAVTHGSIAEEVKDEKPYGEWMLVSSNRRKVARDHRKLSEPSFLPNVSSGSRYDLLGTPNTLNESQPIPCNQTTESVNASTSFQTRQLKPAKEATKNTPNQLKHQKKSNPAPINDSLFSSKAYNNQFSQPILDHSRHSAISISNPKLNPKAPNSAKLNYSHQSSSQKVTLKPNNQISNEDNENFLPKPPDRASPQTGIKLHVGLQVGKHKSRSKENIPNLADEVIKTISRALDPQSSEHEEEPTGDVLDDVEDEGACSSMEH